MVGIPLSTLGYTMVGIHLLYYPGLYHGGYTPPVLYHPGYTLVYTVFPLSAPSCTRLGSVPDDEALGSNLGLIRENGGKRASVLPKV